MSASEKRNKIIAQRVVSAIVFLSIIVIVAFISYQQGYRKGIVKNYLKTRKSN
jgi:hypothetical protein